MEIFRQELRDSMREGQEREKRIENKKTQSPTNLELRLALLKYGSHLKIGVDCTTYFCNCGLTEIKDRMRQG